MNGDSNLTEYVLECVEVIAQKPSPHFAVVCDRIHAHNEYVARLLADAIAFGEAKPQSSDGPTVSGYRIRVRQGSQPFFMVVSFNHSVVTSPELAFCAPG